jgi:hypothetical protein
MTPFFWATSYFKRIPMSFQNWQKIDQCGHNGDGDINYSTPACVNTSLLFIISKAWNHRQAEADRTKSRQSFQL